MSTTTGQGLIGRAESIYYALYEISDCLNGVISLLESEADGAADQSAVLGKLILKELRKSAEDLELAVRAADGEHVESDG